MKTKTNISVSQLVIMLITSRFIVNVTYSEYLADVDNMWYSIFSIVPALILTLIMMIPLYFLYKDDRSLTVVDNSFVLFGKVGIVFAIIYIVFYLWVLIYNMALFNLFVVDVMNPDISPLFLSIAILVVSIYGAWKGIEAIVRTATIILSVGLVLILLMYLSLLPKIDVYNFYPLTTDKLPIVFEGIVGMIIRNSCLPCMAMLLPLVTGRSSSVKKGMIAWSIVVYIAIAVIIVMTVGVLGDYIKTQPFPIYTLSSIADLGVLERLDGIYLAFWTAGSFIKFSMFFYLVSICVKRIFNKKASKISLLISGVLIFIISNMAPANKWVVDLFFNETVLLVLGLSCGILIPLFLLICKKINKYRKKKLSGKKSNKAKKGMSTA